MNEALSVQKVGAVLRKAGFERSKWLKSGKIKGSGRSTAGYSVKLHWNLCVRVSWYEGAWATGSDIDREARHMAELQKLTAALEGAGLAVEQYKLEYGWPSLLVMRHPETANGHSEP